MAKTILVVCLCLGSLAGSYFICRNNWRKYLLLYIISSLVGIILCYGFVLAGFYVFPFRLLPVPIPLVEMLTALPFLVVISVYYSPRIWGYKIAFYWPIVHAVMFCEVLALLHPLEIIQYRTKWDIWDSYSLWWIYLLVFDYVGTLIVPEVFRRPVATESFRFGKPLWIVIHFILIGTIFLAGVYVGRNLH